MWLQGALWVREKGKSRNPEREESQKGIIKGGVRWFCLVGWHVRTSECLKVGKGTMIVRELKCEYRTDPLGIDVLRPRLSWVLESDRRGEVQTAYQILVASSKEALASDKGDLWDSGKVHLAQSVHVVYSGRDLKSREQCFWKVRAWDKQGRESEWSKPAMWSMGLLQASDWSGKWIGFDGGANPDYLAYAKWIWSASEGETVHFRRVVEISADREVSAARVTLATRGKFSLWINGTKIADGAKTIFGPTSEADVEKYLRPGANVVAVSASVGENKDETPGLLCAFSAEFEAGEPMLVNSNAEWKASVEASGGWEKLEFDDSKWAAAKELAANGEAPFEKVLGDDFKRLPSRMLRREFNSNGDIKRATAYMCGLGLSELYINGKRIGDRVLSPGLTDYSKRALYVTYDVTENVKTGENAIGVMLGNGRFFAPRNAAPTGTISYGYPKLLLQVEIEHRDGSISSVVSDGSWKLTDAGPIRANSEYDGEVYDARRAMDGWSKPEFDDGKWRKAELVEGPAGVLRSEMAEPIRVMEHVKPVAITNPRPGVHIFDMGQNMVGWCRLKVKGPRGTRVYLRHSETLKPDGGLYLDNIRSAKVTDEYVLRGDGEEVYEPRFTYHGFRYVEVTGYPGEPGLSAIEGVVVHDGLDRAGEFSCSNALINQIYKNMYWGIRSNYRSVPMDCPQRDERQGWFGDRAQVSKGEMYVFDTAALETKWIHDMEDSQRPDGSIPDVAPAFWTFYSNSITFPTVALVLPGHLYTQYGDTRILETHYDCMRRWVEMVIPQIVDGILPRDTYGDWCPPPEEPELWYPKGTDRTTDPQIVSTVYFYGDLRLMARYASAIGRDGDAARYSGLADEIRTAYNKKFFDEAAGVYGNGTQTSAVLSLSLGIVPEERRQRVFENLVHNVMVKENCHIGTGMIGNQWLMRALSDNGRPDVAYKLVTQTTYPSWGYMIDHGATTIWELWNGDHGNPLMNSHNHVMQIGDLCIWLHEYVAGIKPDEDCTGFRHIIMNPSLVGELTSAKAYRKTMYGRISSDWKIEGGVFSWDIEVPANTTATVYVPATGLSAVTEGGKPVEGRDGVKLARVEGDRVVLEVGAGKYSFRAKG